MTPTIQSGCAGITPRWSGAWPPRTSCITRTRCAVRRSIDYYGEFVRVGHALGGTDLPTTKAETLDCLKSYLPRLAVTHGMAMSTGPNLPMPHSAVDWAIRDTMPKWAKELIAHRDPNIVERTARRAVVWSIINGLHVAAGTAPEFRQAQARVKSGTTVSAHAADLRDRRRSRAQPR